MRFEKDGSGKPNAQVIDLSGSTAHSAPLAIAGSDVSVASTLSKIGHGESNTSFARILLGSEAVTSAQTFATAQWRAQWRPKEPPCYYGRSTEDVHTWAPLCAIISPLWEVMTHTRSCMPLPSCVMLRMSGIWHTKEEIVRYPEIGLS